MGGDHKCPLCSATFTRPQHVGRHLRAHTGDRPYECKQCPLKFARSDLLSRHVNKAHPKPPNQVAEEAAAAKVNGEKKVSSSSNAKGKKKADDPPPRSSQPASARSSADLSGAANGILPLPYYPPVYNPSSTSQQPYGIQMQLSQSDSGVHPALVRPPAYGNEQMVAAMHQQVPFKQEKARACDQCNHSKVKCDSGRPCAKCIHRSMACTYDKPSKNRSANQQHPPAQSARVEPDRRRNSYAAPEQTPNFHPHLQQQQPQGYYPSPPGMYNPSPPYVNYNQTFTPSPQNQHLAPTPSLTHTTSPAGSDEYLESHRGSVPNFIPTLGPSQEGLQWTTSPETSNYRPPPLDASPQYPQNYYASVPPSMLQNGTAMDPANLYQWPQGTQIPMFDPRYQVQNAPVFASDDEESSLAASNSTNSSFMDLTDLNKVQAQAQAQGRPPRRLSTGVWQNAFDQMSLQDRLNADMAAVQEHAPDADYLAVRPTFPTYDMSNGQGEQRMPSLSDTKDLWKMFMTDPNAPQPQPQPQLVDERQEQPSNSTPRPGMGKRTLSKSNSMPDLNSPVANSALFSSFLNGNTPRAAPEGAADPVTVRKWSQELQARQGNFKMQMDTVTRKSSSPLDGQTSPVTDKKQAMGTWQAMPPPERPLASVRQGASLQQTLAPERTPSFNLTPQAWDPSTSFNSGPFPHTPQSHHRVQSMSSASLTPTKLGFSLSGVPPAFARPGNKRLPSQTLMPETQKRASFSVFDEDDGGPSPESDYAAVAHDKVARHQAVGVAGQGQYAPSYMPQVSQSPHQVSLNNNTISSSPSYSSPLSSYSPQTSNLQQPALVSAAQTWSTWPPLTAGQPQLAGLDDLRKGL